MSNVIAEMTWMEFDVRRKNCHTVILPTGACEGYGPHLPLGSDTYSALAVAQLVSEKTGAFIGPVLPVGDSQSISMFPGTITVRPESFKEYLRDIISSLLGWGMKNFLFINGHAGNTPIIQQLSYDFMTGDHSLQFTQIDWWRYASLNSGEIFENKGYMAQGHASECGTSVMLHLLPELVHMEKAECYTPKMVGSKLFPNINRYTLFSAYSDDCTIGDATKATKEKGEALVTRCVENIVSYMKQDFKVF